MRFYITADRVGQVHHGGGQVTYHESEALKSLSKEKNYVQVVTDEKLNGKPFEQDEDTAKGIAEVEWNDPKAWPDEREMGLRLAHFYAGCFSKTVAMLKERGCLTTYTSAAHDKDLSHQEHERLGLPYPYPHLVEPELWQRYLRGYLEADVLIVPSQLSKRVMESYGAKNRIEVIPHGITIPDENCLRPLPKTFTVGYLGAFGADKGIPYLLEAWKKLNYKDAVLKLAGGNSHSQWADYLVSKFGGGNVQLLGWIDDPADFYNSISVLVQPSVSEGFGLEVLEAMAYGRPVICSYGAGAVDVIIPNGPSGEYFGQVVPARDVDFLAYTIDTTRKQLDLERAGKAAREHAANYSWEIIRERYANVWRELLGEKQ